MRKTRIPIVIWDGARTVAAAVALLLGLVALRVYWDGFIVIGAG